MPIHQTMLLVSALLIALLPDLSGATKSFFYNDDVYCGYPMEEFSIDSITCKDSNAYTYLSDYNDDDDDGLCWFGQNMDVVGTVTTSEPIYRYFNAKLQVCFQNQVHSQYSFRGYTKCFTYTRKIDLLSLSKAQKANNDKQAAEEAAYQQAQQGDDDGDQQDEEETEASNQDYANSQNSNYLQAGSHVFQTRFSLPKKTFAFHEGKSCAVHNVSSLP